MTQKKPKSENRRRNEPVLVRFTKEEYEKVETKAESLGCTKPAFIRAATFGYDTRTVDLKKSVKELNAIGRNLNQLARSHNQGVELDNEILNQTLLQVEAVVKIAQDRIDCI